MSVSLDLQIGVPLTKFKLQRSMASLYFAIAHTACHCTREFISITFFVYLFIYILF